jgi:ComF family protein
MDIFKTLLLDFFSLFYPRICHACQKALIREEECICSFCRFELPLTNLYKERVNPLSKIFWGRIDIETATALFYFQKGGKIQILIHQFKYKGKTGVGIYMGQMLGFQLKGHPIWEPVDVIVPVPLHKSKMKKRGFNQSEIFGRGLSMAFEKPMVTDNLVRITRTDTQTRKSRFRRWENVETVFHINHPGFFAGKNVLLIDDVVTTGSTLEACAAQLKNIKGVRVWIATIAMAT